MQAQGQAPPNRGRTFPAELLTEAEIRALVRQCSMRAPTGVRDRALILTLYRSGMRLGEALALHLANVIQDGGSVQIVRRPGSATGVIRLEADDAEAVADWLGARRGLGLPAGLLFCTLDGGPVSDGHVRNMLRRRASKAGIGRRVHAEGLRRGAPPDAPGDDLTSGSIAAVRDEYPNPLMRSALNARAQVRVQGEARTYHQAHLVARLGLGLLGAVPVACQECGADFEVSGVARLQIHAALNWPEVPGERLRTNYAGKVFSIAPETDYIPLCHSCHRRMDSWRAVLPPDIVAV